MRLFATVVVVTALFAAGPAVAETRLSGIFVANKACPALQSIKQQTNPGNVTLQPGKGYKLMAANNTPATHYWIVVPGAEPDFRWAATGCGTVASEGPDALPPPAPKDTTSAPTPRPAPPPSVGKAEYVLAISWEPAFCESSGARECRNQKATSYEATRFALHGLWPQPRSRAYCGVSASDQATDKAHDWAGLPPVDLTPSVRSNLAQVMPGTQSLLERHEWIVHGTCSGASQDTYFARAALFTGTINNTAVARLFAANIGKRLDGRAIRAAFDTAFGKGAGNRVRISCDDDGGRRLITEITVGLRGDVMGTGGIGELIAGSSPTDPGCSGGIVDPVGRQ